jgi:hypothetical protein
MIARAVILVLLFLAQAVLISAILGGSLWIAFRTMGYIMDKWREEP